MNTPPNWERLLFAAVLALALFPIWGVYYTPLLDFPEHVLMTQITAHGSYDAGPSYHGRLVLHSLFAPYSLLYLLAWPIARLTAAIWAVKLLLSAAVLGMAFSLRRLLRSMGGDPFAFYFGFPFFFSTIYLTGFIPYLLGMPVALLLVESLVLQPRMNRTNFLPRLALLFVLLWAHPLLYAGVAPMLAVMLLVARGGIGRPAERLGLCRDLGWLALPALYLLAWTPTLSASTQIDWSTKFTHGRAFVCNLGAYDLDLDQAFWLPKLPLLAWLALCCWTWLRGRRRGMRLGAQDPERMPESRQRGPRAIGAAIITLLFLALALPEHYSGQMVTATIRLTPIAAILAAAVLPARFTRPRAARAMLVFWCLAVPLANSVLAWRFDRHMDGFANIARRMEARQTAIMLFDGPGHILFHHVVSYYHAEKGGISPQTMLVVPGILHYPAKLTAPLPWGDTDWEHIPDVAGHPSMRTFRYVIVKSAQASRAMTANLPFHRLQARYGDWVLFVRPE